MYATSLAETIMTRLTRRQALRLAAVSISSVALAACRRREQCAGRRARRAPTATAIATPSVTRQVNATATALATATATPPAPRRDAEWGSGPSVSITPINDFFDVAISQRDDWFAAQPYTLNVSGLVERPLSLSLDDIKALPAVEQMRTLECIGNASGGSLIGNALWKGVRLADVLRLAGVRSLAVEIKVTGADNYATSVPLALATQPDALLVYEMNGEPLPGKHGTPLRALFPSRYGQKDPKWITAIEAISEPFVGFWESQGWSNDAIIRVNSQIRTPESGDRLSPGVIVISGTALANESGVARLEVSADGGQTWREARLVHGPTPLAWSEWRYEWQAQAGGDVTLMARAADNDGNQQPLKADDSAAPRRGHRRHVARPPRARGRRVLASTCIVHRRTASVKPRLRQNA